jgi:hypothetical protein
MRRSCRPVACAPHANLSTLQAPPAPQLKLAAAVRPPGCQWTAAKQQQQQQEEQEEPGSCRSYGGIVVYCKLEEEKEAQLPQNAAELGPKAARLECNSCC